MQTGYRNASARDRRKRLFTGSLDETDRCNHSLPHRIRQSSRNVNRTKLATTRVIHAIGIRAKRMKHHRAWLRIILRTYIRKCLANLLSPNLGAAPAANGVASPDSSSKTTHEQRQATADQHSRVCLPCSLIPAGTRRC